MRRLIFAALTVTAVLALSIPAYAQDNNQNCKDFGSRQDAQAHLNADKSDPDNLDADNDGKACEDFKFQNAEGDKAPSAQPDQLAFTGSNTPAYLGIGVLLVLLGSGILFRTRRAVTH